MTEQQYIEMIASQNAVLILSVAAVICVMQLAGEWQIFKKAGSPGWACLVPLYSSYTSYKIFWGNGWLFLIAEAFTLASSYASANSIIKTVCFVGSLIIGVMHNSRIAKAFGKSAWYAVGLVLLHPVFMCILGFGDAQYLGVPEE